MDHEKEDNFSIFTVILFPVEDATGNLQLK